MAEQNAYQVADWDGQGGERWVAYQARLDAMLAVFGQAAIEAAAPATGERVLDVGCGAGASSLALAARVGAGGQVLGVDISEPLIGRASLRQELGRRRRLGVTSCPVALAFRSARQQR
jgi:SAM-dependent methyltransferase